jgi:AcrR family transcriptional regulator
MNEIQKRIVEATKHILESKGLSVATTRAIAKEAQCAEGSLYNHFKNRADLLLAVFRESVPRFSDALNSLAFRVGEETVEENLKTVFLEFLPFYRQVAPLMGSLFSELELLADYQRSLSTSGKGPRTSQDQLAAYLKAEQRLGRVSASANVEFCSEIILGSCFQRAFREKFMEARAGKKKEHSQNDSAFAEQLAEAMARILGAR